MRLLKVQAFAIIAFVLSSLCTRAYAQVEEDPYVERCFGSASATIYYDAVSYQTKSFRFPTSHGFLVGGRLTNGNRTIVKINFEGDESQKVTLTSEPISAETTEINVFYPSAESVTYTVTDADAQPVETTIQYCDQIPASNLMAAIHEVREATDVFNAAPPDPDAYFVALNGVLRMIDSVPAAIVDCDSFPTGIDCPADSPNEDECEDCCEDVGWLWGTGIAIPCAAAGAETGGLAIVACGGAVYLQARDCKRDCRRAFDPIPPGGQCGNPPNLGTCVSICPISGRVVPGHCDLAHVCCH